MALKDGKEMITIVVTPLNLFGKQNQATLEKAGLPAVAVSKENASVETWGVIESVQHAVKNCCISAAILAQLLQCCTLAQFAAVTVLLDTVTLHMLMSLKPMLGLIKDFGDCS